MAFLRKSTVATLGKNGLHFIPTSGHTVRVEHLQSWPSSVPKVLRVLSRRVVVRLVVMSLLR